jgi:hypothetical protein
MAVLQFPLKSAGRRRLVLDLERAVDEELALKAVPVLPQRVAHRSGSPEPQSDPVGEGELGVLPGLL